MKTISLPVALMFGVLSGVLVSLPWVSVMMTFTAWVCFVPLLFVIEVVPTPRAVLVGWVCGVVTHLVGFYWIPGLLTRFAKMPFVLALLLMLLFAAWGGVWHALVTLIASLLRRSRSGLPALVVLPLAYTAVEFVFPQLFPWALAGAQYRVLPFIQAAEVVGVLGLSGLMVLAGCAVYELIAPRAGFIPRAQVRPWWALGAIALVVVVVMLGNARLAAVTAMREDSASVHMGVVQPNVGMDDKKDRNRRGEQLAQLQRMSALLEKDGAEIVVWPESAYPYDLRRSVNEDRTGDRQIVKGFSLPVVFGAVSRDQSGIYNSAFLATPRGELSAPVDKNHLVLFSENPPLRDLWPESLTRKYRFLRAGFQPGTSPGVLEAGDARMGILICLEDISADFGREVVSADANVLINVTNDAWFGDTAEPEQHLALAVFRAVETRRDLVRSVNTGISAFVHATGEVEIRTETFEQSRFVADVRLLETTTVFARVGNWVGWFSMGALVLLGVWTTIRRRRTRSEPEVEDEK